MRSSAWYTLVAALLILWIGIPVAYTFLAAFADVRSYYEHLLPLRYTLENIEVFLRLGALDATLRSLAVAVLAIIISFALGLPAGYVLGRWVFRGREAFRLAIFSARMFPVMIMAVPMASLFISIGLYDTLIGVALVHAALALPFVVLISSSIFASVPKELEEAGIVFGLTRWQVLTRITAPLAAPGLAAAAMFTFVVSWNEAFAATILASRERTLPALTVATTVAGIGGAAPDPYKFAAAMLLSLPAFLIMAYMRKYLTVMWGSRR
jgi:multiple sugar transport system permease protein